MTKCMHSKILKITYQQKDFELSIKLKEGSGHLIIFIHGLGCAKESFDDLWDLTRLFQDFSLLTFAGMKNQMSWRTTEVHALW